jgi:hypothetical protein
MAMEKEDQRRFGRWRQPEKAELTIGDGPPIPCTVLDLSAGGVKIATSAGPGEAPAVGAVVSLAFDDLPPFQARVERREGDAIGLSFIGRPQYVFR